MKQRLSMLITLALALVALAGLWLWWSDPIERDDARQIATGTRLYAEHCASCHGADLEGQANWRERRADGKLPAPPHAEPGQKLTVTGSSAGSAWSVYVPAGR